MPYSKFLCSLTAALLGAAPLSAALPLPMAAAKKAAAKAAAAAAKASGPAPGPAAAADSGAPDDNVNAKTLADVNAKLQTIYQHDTLKSVKTLPPKEISDTAGSGHQEPFRLASYLVSMRQNKKYRCGGNFFWGNFLKMANPRVHTNEAARENAALTLFSDMTSSTSDLPDLILEVLDPTQDPAPLLESTGFGLLGPEELYWGYLDKLAADCENGSRSLIKVHLGKILSCSVEFRYFDDPDDRKWFIINYREKLVGQGDIAQRTPMQRAAEIAIEREGLSKGTGKKRISAAAVSNQISTVWSQKFQKAPSSDEITLAYVDASLTCTDRLFKYPSCREIVLQGERFFTSKGAEKKSPYHSIYKLEGFVKKGKTQANIEWGLAQTLYAIQEGHYDVGEVGLDNLTGKRRPGNKGLLDIFFYKRQVGEELLKLASECGFPADSITKIKEMAKNHEQWRQAKKNKKMMELPPTDREIAALHSEVVFGQHYDNCSGDKIGLKTGVVEAIDASDFVKRSTLVKEKFDEVHETVKELLRGVPTQSEAAAQGSDDNSGSDVEMTILQKSIKQGETADDDGQLTDDTIALIHATSLIKMSHATAELLSWAKYCVRLSDDLAGVIVDNNRSKDDLADSIKGHPAGRVRGGKAITGHSTHVGIWCHHPSGFEADCRPLQRVACYQDTILTRRISAVMASREGSAGDLASAGDIYFVLNGKKEGLKDQLLKPFAKAKCIAKHALTLNFDSDSLGDRKHRVQGGFGSTPTTETMYLRSLNKINVERKKNLPPLTGWNSDTNLGPIFMPAWSSPELWTVLYKEKLRLLGPARIRSGGPVDGDSDEEAEKNAPSWKPPKMNDKVPISYHSLPAHLIRSLSHGCNIIAWVDVAMTDPYVAVAATLRGVPSLSIVPTEALQRAVKPRIVQRLWESFSDPSSEYHKPELSTLLLEAEAKHAAKPAPKFQPAAKKPAAAAQGGSEEGADSEAKGGSKPPKKNASASGEGAGGPEAKKAKKAGSGKEVQDPQVAALLNRLKAAEEADGGDEAT